MKIITLKQPWASLISEGIKEYEIRNWKTKYRGPILIHAGKGVYKEHLKSFDIDYPKSRVVAKAILEDCLLIDDKLNKKLNKINKKIYGPNSVIGKYAWKLSHIEKINSNRYIKGRLGLWDIEF